MTPNTEVEGREFTRTDEFALDEACEQITELPTTKLGTRSHVWATFHTDADEVAAVCETAFKNRDVVMWKADREQGLVSIKLKKFADV